MMKDISGKERTKSVLNKGAQTVALLFNPHLVLSLKIMKNTRLSREQLDMFVKYFDTRQRTNEWSQ